MLPANNLDPAIARRMTLMQLNAAVILRAVAESTSSFLLYRSQRVKQKTKKHFSARLQIRLE